MFLDECAIIQVAEVLTVGPIGIPLWWSAMLRKENMVWLVAELGIDIVKFGEAMTDMKDSYEHPSSSLASQH